MNRISFWDDRPQHVVWCCDRNEVTRTLMGQILRPNRFTVEEFSGVDTLSELLADDSRPKPDLLIVNATGEDREAVRAALRAINEKTWLNERILRIAIVRKSNGEDMSLAWNNGADGHISTPIDPVDTVKLMRRFSEHIQRRASASIAQPAGH